ncbi:Maleamate amidohydrolase [Lentibacillus sp. JNUCC-1]|uniref:isochorismatase family cysteine hydrolase n=1 Tax=Lentibacillus sp. JNUCC-1 TaxID=2654513 RepID=UPI0012E94D83|nr:isochorismatase family cysteine hydrolase [Lentibacillus sp. JNUCC-1]MUV37716.1 Maleamate amidohydrolase [Lentibacillus sp. JNUCC-1]
MNNTNTALLLIDMQKESDFGIENMETAVSNAEQMIAACRKLDIPVVYTRHINRSDQVGLSNNEPMDQKGKPLFYNDLTAAIEIVDQIKPAEKDIVIDKYRWSSFYDTSLDLMLKSMGIKHLIVGGFVTDGCLVTTVFDAYFRDYQVNLIKDMSGATNEGSQMASILMMANWVYDLAVYDTSEMIKQLEGKPATSWQSSFPDQLQFTPETMRDVFEKLNQPHCNKDQK